MPISFRRLTSPSATLLAPAFLLCLLSLAASPAIAQDQQPEKTPLTKLQKQLDRIDLGVVAAGEISTSVHGIEKRDADVTTVFNNTTYTSTTDLNVKPSRTVGELATLRYTAKPWVGFEFNFSNLRYTQNYTFTTTTTPPPPSNFPATPNYLPGGVQSGHRELTLGYVAHLKYRPFGITPYVGAGGGTIGFHPTRGGGQGLPFQYRAAYYYSVGVEDNFPNSPFGMRLGFRQIIYLAPDFQQNYLTITRRTRTSEPIIGFFLRF
jgi:hypothetical protein